jgi:hypothetical protein
MAKRKPTMSVEDLCTAVSSLVEDARKYGEERSADRIKAIEYFDGEMKDVKAEDDRSKVVSRDTRAIIKKVLPSIKRTLLGSAELVEYLPQGQEDEAGAEQASDYVNFVALPECKGRKAIWSAIHDAVKLRNGILKWFQKKTIDVKVSSHTGLDEAAFAQLVSDPDVEVLAYSQRVEMIDTPQGPVQQPAHDVKIKRRVETSLPAIVAVPPENWLIHPDAVSLEDSPILGESYKVRRSDLVKMGYDRKVVDDLHGSTGESSEHEAEETARRRDVFNRDSAPTRSLEEVEFYDLLVRIDYDDDGIAELRRMVFAGGLKEENLLENTEWDEINYADVVSEERPHQWEGNSIPDDTMDIQQIKTVLLRGTLDNLYWQNNLQPIVQEGQVQNPEAVLNPKFGQVIRVPQGTPVHEAVGYSQVPMVADKSFNMMAYLDGELADRTGINDASSGLAPDALQNMTAKASALIEQAGIGQTEMMVSCIAESLAPVFKGFLRLVVQHQDKPRTVRLRNEWVTVDPRSWNASMDAQVNTGLGAGTRERDVIAVQQVIALQKELLATLGPNNPYVKPEQLYNAIAKLVQATGLKNVQQFFTKPDPQEIEALQKAQQDQPNPEQMKAEAAMKLEEARTQGRMQIEQMRAQARLAEYDKKMQADAAHEQAQRDADLQVKLAELEKETEAKRQDIVAAAQREADRRETELQKADIQQQTEREWMDTQVALLDRKIAADALNSVRSGLASVMSGRAVDRMQSGNQLGRQVT